MLALLAVVMVVATAAALRYRINLLFAAPLLLVMGLLIVYDYKQVFFLLIASIPVSMQVELSSSFALDVFSEPLMLVFLAIFLLHLLGGRLFRPRGRIYPYHLLVFLILFWIVVTTITSEVPARSFKFLLAKLWYLAPFVYMAERLLRTPGDVRRLFWAFFVPLVLVSAGVSVLHAAEGFSFESANTIASPIFPNGVIYSATLVLFIPWVWTARSWYTPRSLQWYLIVAGTAVLLIGILFSYKRGAWLGTLMLPVLYLLMQRGWLDKLVLAGLGVLLVVVVTLVSNNNYYYFAPNYQSTVWHGDDLEAHLSATFDGTEISGMERFYRWVAAKNMIADMPVFGSGPSTFNQVYKRYADDAFATYVSDNPEQSTTHNYFLMTFAEQGFIGGLLFGLLCIYMFIKGIRLYSRIQDPARRSLVLMFVLSLSTILFHSLLNEMIEVDKIGPMFWLLLTLIHQSEVWEGA
ncbi:MAG: hypothetical protein OHK0039_18700 [Bacteroidia bacterium]